jgi:hypothetical protein
VDGDLLDGGHVVFGTIDRASRDDIGAEIAVRVDGDSAWTVTNRLPYILGACGLAVALIGALAGLLAARGRRRMRQTATIDTRVYGPPAIELTAPARANTRGELPYLNARTQEPLR